MTAYALARLLPRTPMPSDVLDYIERIQQTLNPFGGRFLIHGGPVDVKEGAWEGDVVLLAFPDMDSAHAWYDSPAYAAIKRLRTDHLSGDVLLVNGVDDGYDPATMAAKLRATEHVSPGSVRDT